jgi:serine/threonine-protein kinase
MSHAIRTRYLDFSHRRQAACRLADDSSRRITKDESGPVVLRSAAERVSVNRAASVFQIDAFHQPRQYLENNFGAVKDGVIVDAMTNLAWQQSGSESVLPWDQANEYIHTLNHRKSGGYENWRLPTINELLSLLTPPPPGEDFCFQSSMSSLQKWIWSGDTRSKRAAWYLDVEMGFVASGDVLDGFYVKAVCSV